MTLDVLNRGAARLDALAAEHGDPRLRRAAGILRGGLGGRPAVDDSEPLALAQSLLAAGLARSRHAAARRAARLYASGAAEATRMVRRLEKKMARK